MQTSSSSPALFGSFGCVLRVDCASGRSERQSLSPEILRSFLGGSGLGTALLLREDAASLPALDPRAPLVFAFSPLVGSPLTTSAKFAIVSKSPLTSRINDSLVSSGFAIAGKKCGCDAILLVGRAPQASILVIDDGNARLDSAAEFRGLSCPETERLLAEHYGSDFRFAVIGPAGENQVLFATISHDGRHAGRGGSGAVLGSKNIKAIAIRGSQRCAWANPAELVEKARDLSERSFGAATAKYRELGTAANLLLFNRMKTLPTRNFQQASFEGAEALAPETLASTRGRVRSSCVACTIGCEHIYSLHSGADARDRGVRVEYENLFALGPLCAIDNPDAVLAASRLCDELGIDTISAGGTIAFAMECAERGYLDLPWLRFGSADGMLKMLGMIGRREGIGDLLAEGSRRAADRIGHDAASIAPHVKGLELPGYEPRSLKSMAIGFATGTRGADHNRSGAYEADFSDRTDRRTMSPKSAELAIETENKAALMDSLILCKFLRGVFADFYAEAAEMLKLVTGWDVTPDELHQTAERIVAAKKLFNIQAGWEPAEDTLPERFLVESPGDDPNATLTASQLREGVRAYNVGRGWSEEGWIDTDQERDLQRRVAVTDITHR